MLLAKLPPDPNAVTTQAVRVAVRNTPGVRTARSVWKRFVEFLAERNVVIASYDDTPASVVTAAVMPSAQETSEHYAASSWDSGPVLAAFDTWMQHHDYAQKTRAKTVSYLRTALGLIKKPANSRDVADYHDSLAPPARGQLRVAWRLLVEFCVDVGVKPVPAACPARAHPGRGGVRVAMPLVVAQAVAFFGERASAAVLSRLKWGHVVVEDGDVYLRPGRRAPREFTAPVSIEGQRHLGVLRAWATGAAHVPEAPLFAVRLGAYAPMTSGLITWITDASRQDKLAACVQTRASPSPTVEPPNAST